MERFPDWIKDLQGLSYLHIAGCPKLASLPELPPSLRALTVDTCESIETVSFPFNSQIESLCFPNCFKLGIVARIVIIMQSGHMSAFLPAGRIMPLDFDHRATGNSVTVFSKYFRFRICVVIDLLCRILINVVLFETIFRLANIKKPHLFISQPEWLDIDGCFELDAEILFTFSTPSENHDIIECGVKKLTEETNGSIDSYGSYDFSSEQVSGDEDEIHSKKKKEDEDESVLENGNGVGREASARCLMKLTENSANAWSVSAHGGVSAMLKICSCGEFGGELIGTSCGVLRNLVGVEEIKRYMIEEDDTVATFIKLIGSKEEIVQVNSIDLLLSMCCKDVQTREILVRGGGIQELVSVLSDPNSLSSSKSKETALRAIDNLCFGSAGCLNALMSCKFLDHLLNLLRNGENSVQESALKVTSRLCSLQEEVKRIMGDAGFMPELVKFLDAKSLDVREMASVALYYLISVPRNRKKFAQDDFNISHILQLLDHEDGSNVSSDSSNTKFLISILMSLTSCNSARRKIATSGYLKSIEKLAETEGSDAKKLVKKLSMNKFRSILSGIWHS